MCLRCLTSDGQATRLEQYGDEKLKAFGSGRPDRRYERMDISGLTGVTEAQRDVLLALGAIDHAAR